jgi:hypothetical protein
VTPPSTRATQPRPPRSGRTKCRSRLRRRDFDRHRSGHQLIPRHLGQLKARRRVPDIRLGAHEAQQTEIE